MSRLIDAEKLAKEGWVLTRHGTSNRVLTTMSLADVPTAFDIEKVVWQLQKRHDFYEKRFEEMSGTDRDVEDWGSIKSYKDAIEIVKGGGVNE